MIATEEAAAGDVQQEFTGCFEQDYIEACRRINIKPFQLLKFGLPLPPLPNPPPLSTAATANGIAGMGGNASMMGDAFGRAGADDLRRASVSSPRMIGSTSRPFLIPNAVNVSGEDPVIDGTAAVGGTSNAAAGGTGTAQGAGGAQSTAAAGVSAQGPPSTAAGAAPGALAVSNTAGNAGATAGGPAGSNPNAASNKGGAAAGMMPPSTAGGESNALLTATLSHRGSSYSPGKSSMNINKKSTLDLFGGTSKTRNGSAAANMYYHSRYKFSPTIDVETNENEEEEEIYKLEVRGWKLSIAAVESLNMSIAACTTITTLNFWNCGLTEAHVNLLASTISAVSIRTLAIDQNPLVPESFYATFLGEDSMIKSLSLRGNGIPITAPKGADSLAEALRFNPVLQSLSVGKNSIGNDGATAFAKVLSNYALTQDELQVRRKQLAEIDRLRHDMEDDAASKKKGRVGRGASAKQACRGEKGRQEQAWAKGAGQEGRRGCTATASRQDPEDAKNKKQQAQGAVADDKKGKDKKGVLTAKGNKKGKVEDTKEDVEEGADTANGVEPMFESNGQWYILGNRALNSLNLTHNGALLDAVLDQEATNDQAPDGMLGIFRISLQHNPVDLESPMHVQLQSLLNSETPEIVPDGTAGEQLEVAQSESESTPDEAGAQA
ncbi:hypothetical protein BC831DRAFT_472407 [Entophlyctis helioformis]|nr:hypothetical protein BC831DRAFT_472407 [Entophlyctis helioformis]